MKTIKLTDNLYDVLVHAVDQTIERVENSIPREATDPKWDAGKELLAELRELYDLL